MSGNRNSESGFRIFIVAVAGILIAIFLLILNEIKEQNRFRNEAFDSEISVKYNLEKRRKINENRKWPQKIDAPEIVNQSEQASVNGQELNGSTITGQTAGNSIEELVEVDKISEDHLLSGVTAELVIKSEISYRSDPVISALPEISVTSGITIYLPEPKSDSNIYSGINKKGRQPEEVSSIAADWLNKIMASWDPDKLKNLSEQGIKATREGRYDDAIIEHQKALGLNIYVDQLDYVEKAILYFNLGIAYRNKAVTIRGDITNFKLALKNFNQAVNLNPQYIQAWRQIAECSFYSGDPEISANAYLKILNFKSRSATAYIGLGMAYQQKGDYVNAIMAYEEAMDLNPHSDFVRYNLCLLYKQENDYQRIVECK